MRNGVLIDVSESKRPTEYESTGAILSLQDRLYHRALRLERSSDGAQDLVQETITRALEHFETYTAGTNLCGWLMTIMWNLFVDSCRRRKLEHTVDPRKLSHMAAETPQEMPLWRTTPCEDVSQIVPRLSPALQQVVALYLEGIRSYDRIGESLGISIAAVGGRLFRARRQMRALLQGEAARTFPAARA